MEITLLSKHTVRIKGKKTTLVLDPDTQVDADAILTLNNNAISGKVQPDQLIIQGAGEYEVGGIKISVYANGGEYLYDMTIDNTRVVAAQSQILQRMKEKLTDRDILLFHASEELNPALVTQLSPQAVVLYGEHSMVTAKALGKDAQPAVKKYQVTKEKLPVEMEVVILQ